MHWAAVIAYSQVPTDTGIQIGASAGAQWGWDWINQQTDPQQSDCDCYTNGSGSTWPTVGLRVVVPSFIGTSRLSIWGEWSRANVEFLSPPVTARLQGGPVEQLWHQMNLQSQSIHLGANVLWPVGHLRFGGGIFGGYIYTATAHESVQLSTRSAEVRDGVFDPSPISLGMNFTASLHALNIGALTISPEAGVAFGASTSLDRGFLRATAGVAALLNLSPDRNAPAVPLASPPPMIDDPPVPELRTGSLSASVQIYGMSSTGERTDGLNVRVFETVYRQITVPTTDTAPSTSFMLEPDVADSIVQDVEYPRLAIDTSYRTDAGLQYWELTLSHGRREIARYSSDKSTTRPLRWQISTTEDVPPIHARYLVVDSAGRRDSAQASFPMHVDRYRRVMIHERSPDGNADLFTWTLFGVEPDVAAANQAVVAEVVRHACPGASIEVISYGTGRTEEEAASITSRLQDALQNKARSVHINTVTKPATELPELFASEPSPVHVFVQMSCPVVH
jgi:hypothetical protein